MYHYRYLMEPATIAERDWWYETLGRITCRCTREGHRLCQLLTYQRRLKYHQERLTDWQTMVVIYEDAGQDLMRAYNAHLATHVADGSGNPREYWRTLHHFQKHLEMVTQVGM